MHSFEFISNYKQNYLLSIFRQRSIAEKHEWKLADWFVFHLGDRSNCFQLIYNIDKIGQLIIVDIYFKI
jgi:hypothetical protein